MSKATLLRRRLRTRSLRRFTDGPCLRFYAVSADGAPLWQMPCRSIKRCRRDVGCSSQGAGFRSSNALPFQQVLYRPVKRNVSSRFLMEHPSFTCGNELFVEVFFPSRGQFCQGSAHIVRADGEFLLGENEVKGNVGGKLVERFVVEPVFDLLRFHSCGQCDIRDT